MRYLRQTHAVHAATEISQKRHDHIESEWKRENRSVIVSEKGMGMSVRACKERERERKKPVSYGNGYTAIQKGEGLAPSDCDDNTVRCMRT